MEETPVSVLMVNRRIHEICIRFQNYCCLVRFPNKVSTQSLSTHCSRCDNLVVARHSVKGSERVHMYVCVRVQGCSPRCEAAFSGRVKSVLVGFPSFCFIRATKLWGFPWSSLRCFHFMLCSSCRLHGGQRLRPEGEAVGRRHDLLAPVDG